MILRVVLSLMIVLVAQCGAASVLAQERRQSRCPEGPLAAMNDRLRNRDPAAEARQNVDQGDIRPMIFYNAGPAGVFSKVEGLRCPNLTFEFRETFGIGADGIPQCLVEPLKRAQTFVETYNRELDKAARQRGRDVCADGKEKQINFVVPPQDCTQDVLATSLATLRQRNAVAEAQESVRLRDFRPMIYISSALGVLTPKALGLRCPNASFQGKESYGAAGDAITRCIGEQLARVQQFVEEYNRELDRIAGKNGIDICAGKKRATIP